MTMEKELITFECEECNNSAIGGDKWDCMQCGKPMQKITWVRCSELDTLHARAERAEERERKMETQRDAYMNRASRLESIVRAARSGEYDNAHEINAIRRFLFDSMEEYTAALGQEEVTK
jgi:hypothetical protein